MSDITYINKNLLMEGQLESKDGQVVIIDEQTNTKTYDPWM